MRVLHKGSRVLSMARPLRFFSSTAKEEQKKEPGLRMTVWGGRLLLVNEICVLLMMIGGGAWLLSYAINWDTVEKAKAKMLAKLPRSTP